MTDIDYYDSMATLVRTSIHVDDRSQENVKMVQVLKQFHLIGPHMVYSSIGLYIN